MTVNLMITETLANICVSSVQSLREDITQGRGALLRAEVSLSGGQVPCSPPRR